MEFIKCSKCECLKEHSDFYKNKGGKIYTKKCKTCYKEDVRANRERNKEYYRNYDKLRSNNPDRAEARNLYQQGKGKEKISVLKLKRII